MSKSSFDYLEAAITAYKEKNSATLAQAKQEAFRSRRYSKEKHSADSILNLYPLLGIHQLEELRSKYGITSLVQLEQAILSYEVEDVIAVAAFWQWKAAQKRVPRSAATNLITQIRQALAGLKLRTVVVGEYARHQDTITAVELCLELASAQDVLAVKETLQRIFLAEMQVTAAYLQITLTVDTQDIDCFLYLATKQTICASVIYHTGPKGFIDKVNNKLIGKGYELTALGLKTLEGSSVAIKTEKTLWDLVGSTVPPTSSRDLIDDLMYDTTNIIGYKTVTGDTGIVYNHKNTERLQRLLEVTTISHAGIVITANEKSTKDHIDKVRQVIQQTYCPTYIGLLVTSNTVDQLKHATDVDYVVIEDDDINMLYRVLLPRALKVTKHVILRNPFMYLQGACLATPTFTREDILTRITRSKVAVEITGNDTYAGTPYDAWRDLAATKCLLTLGSAQPATTQAHGIATARIRSSKALLHQDRVMSQDAFSKWLHR